MANPSEINAGAQEKLIKNKIANCLHYYRHTKEPDLEKEVDNIYCLMKSLTPSDLENLK